MIADDNARYFGMEVAKHSLVPEKNPRLGPTTLENWLKSHVHQAKSA